MANGAFAQTLNFELIAGAGEGNGGPALQASLPNAGDLAYDAAGNLYVSMRNNNRIRKIATNGTITTVVGGNTGFGGDGGPASAAKIDRPDGIVFDAAGNLYFSDTGNRRIRRISTNGTITTYAGNGGSASAGDGGQAINASFAGVERIAIDGSGNLYVADSFGNRIRKITPGGIITTIAGTGAVGYTGDGGAATSATLSFPMGVAVGANGVVYIADTNNNAIRRVATDGSISTLLTMDYAYPGEVTLHGADLYTADTGNCGIWKLSTTGGAHSLVAGVLGSPEACQPITDGQAASEAIDIPDGIALNPAGDLVFTDWSVGRVLRIHGGLIKAIAGNGGKYTDGRDAVGAPLGYVLGIAVDDAGNVLMTDNGYHRVHRVSSAGKIASPVGNGTQSGPIIDCGAGGPCYGKSFTAITPWGIVPGDAPGEFLFGDRSLDRIYRVDANGYMTNWAGSSIGNYGDEGNALEIRIDPQGLAKDASGALILANTRAHRVQRIQGFAVTNIAGIGLPASGGDGGAALDATLNGPMAVAVDKFGNVLVSETGGMRIRKFTPGGNITTFAGNASVGASGDGGPATSASIGRVDGIAVHGSDTYISSEGQLRVIGADGIIRAVPGWTHRATALYVRGNVLYIGTAEGHAYRAQLAALPVRAVEHDYDGDGRSDILWRNTSTGANTIWKSANGATPQTVTGVTSQAWKIVGQGDFDGDGKDDIFWRNAQNGANTVWRSGNGATPITTTGVTDLGWTMVGVGDFNRDGKSDLVWRHKTNGKNAIWTSMAGAGLAVTTATDQKWQIVGVGDFDGDGVSDLFWRNATTGANQVWRGGNSATQLAVATAPPAWKLQAVGDFDGNGRSDVFWRNASTGQDVIWNAAFAGTARTLTTVTDLKWKVVAAGDYNGDGKDDLLWRHGTSGANTIWKSGTGTTLQTVTGVTNMAWTIVPYANQP